jgi:hypothetical protein
MTGEIQNADTPENLPAGAFKTIGKLALASAHDWSTIEALKLLPAGQGRNLHAYAERWSQELRPLSAVEPKLDGSVTRMATEKFKPLGAKMKPEISKEQAAYWATAVIMALSDFPPFIIHAALTEALHSVHEYPSDLEKSLRSICDRRMDTQKTALRRLRHMLDEIHRATTPPRPVLEDQREDSEEWTALELHRMTPELRKMGLGKNWITQQMLDEADAQFPTPAAEPEPEPDP